MLNYWIVIFLSLESFFSGVGLYKVCSRIDIMYNVVKKIGWGCII